MAEQEPTHTGVAVIARDSGRVLMLQRSWDETDDPDVRGTWEFPGGSIEEGETSEAAAWREWSEETGLPQPEGETVNGWRSADGVYQGYVFAVPAEAEAFAEINPDSEAADTENPDDPDRRNPDVTAWFTLEQVQNLGPALRPVIMEMDWSVFDLQEDDDMADIETTEEAAVTDDIGPVPWFGILTVEGLPSGDKRMFREGSLRSRPLPLPLTWQKTSAAGHDGNVTVAMIEKVWRQGNFIWGSGHFLQTVEADEVMALIASFGRYGVSIDADDLDEFAVEVHEDGLVEFTDARHCSACIVSIPAFAEAAVAIGEYSDEFAGGWGAPSQPIPSADMEDEEAECENIDPETGECLDEVEDEPEFALTAAAGTEDGPGWLTHPVDTDRLRDYWVRGEGAVKIGWGTPGDFNRCRVNLAKYVKPEYLSGYCANRHKDALGIWPGEHLAGEAMTASAAVEISEVEVAPYLVASGPKANLPLAWFQDPGLEGPTALTVTEEGQIFGHLAIFGTCHIGFDGVCTDVPRSATDYAYFRTGVVRTDGGDVYTGNISMGGGHAGHGLKWRAAAEHYDSTSSVIGDIACGEDEFGIWVAGATRAGVTDEQIAELLASGGLSGDWREVRRGSNELELVAALAVNVGGFPVPRMQIAASGGNVVALVAAGVITHDDDPVEDLVDEVAARLEARAEAKVAAARLDALRQQEALKRLAALRARA